MSLPVGSAFVDIQPQVGAGFFASLSSKLTSGGALGSIGLAAGAAFAGGLVAGVGAFKIGEKFDAVYDEIRIGTGDTGEVFEGLKDTFKTTFADVPADMETVGTAIADLRTRTGLTGDALGDLSTVSIELARITGGDLSTQIDKNTRLFGDWGVETGDQIDTLDRLFRASQGSGTSVDQLASSVVQFGAPLRGLGFDLDSSIALFAKWNAEGVNTETVMSGTRQALAKFAREGRDAPEAFQETIDAITNMESEADATALALEVFGARAGPDMAAAIREGKFDLTDMLDVMNNGTDTIHGVSRETESFGETWTRIKNNVLVIIEPIATRVFQGISKGLEAILPHIPPLVENIGAFAGIIGDVLAPAFDFIQTVFETVTGLFDSTGEKGEQFNEQFATIWGNVSEIFATAQEIITGVMEVITTVIDESWQFISAVWDEHGEAIFAAVVRVFEGISEVVGGVMRTIQGVINTVLALIKGDWSGVWEGIEDIFGGVWDTFEGIVTTVMGTIQGVIETTLGIIEEVWNRIWGSLESAVETVFGGIVGILTGILNGLLAALEDGINLAIRALQTAINTADVIAGPFINFPDDAVNEIAIPRLAAGGNAVTGGLALVGDDDRELINLPTGAQVTPLSGDSTLRGLGGQVVDLRVLLDRRTLVQALGAPLVDEMTIRAGVRS